MFTKERLALRLCEMERKLTALSNYSPENGDFLYKYAIEFEVLLNAFLRINDGKFNNLFFNYIQAAQRFCELGCEMCDEKNRKQAFAAGKTELHQYINICIRILTQQESQSITAIAASNTFELLSADR